MSAAEQRTIAHDWSVLGMHSDTRDHASRLVRLGLHPIELRPADKKPAEKEWQRTPLDPDKLDKRLASDPTRNLGLRMGAQPCGWQLITIDVDAPGALDPLIEKWGELPETLTARTGSDGTHLVFRWPAGRELPGNAASRHAANVDIRAQGGQIVVAPSVHPNGNRYQWTRAIEPAELPPAWVEGLSAKPTMTLAPVTPIRTPEPNTTAADRARAYVAMMPAAISGAGGHVATFNVARKLRDFGLNQQTALTVLREYNSRCEPPWSEGELQHKIEQGFKAQVSNPIEDRPLLQVTANKPGEEWRDSPTDDEPSATGAPKLPQRRGRSVADVLDLWRSEGPLVHEPTGFARLDEMTGGGPVYGSRWYVNGQPNAFKTGLQLQVMHEWARRGIVVGLLAVDEEDTDLLTRLAQRVGHSRKNCEIRSGAVLDQIQAELAALPIRFYDASWTIEDAAADLAAFAARRGEKRMALAIDSLQTVHCDADRITERELSEMAAVTARVQAIRKVASRYRLIALTTSEMSRSAYRKADPDDLTSTMAASKHSGAVEYSARVLLGLRSVKGESDLIEVDVAKNKHGPSGELVYLRVDRSEQSLWQANYEAPPKPDRTEAKASRFAAECTAVLDCLPEDPTKHLSREDLMAALADKGRGCSQNTLKTRMAQLIKDGLARDLSDGSKNTARQYARAAAAKA
jgi:KaiC/GvpD/RAD55 family RecA-like ATPase